MPAEQTRCRCPLAATNRHEVGCAWARHELGCDRAPEAIDHPQHYGGAENPYEAIKVIEAWQLDFCLGNAVKYIARAGKKDPTKTVEDLKKARFYLERKIGQLEKQG